MCAQRFGLDNSSPLTQTRKDLKKLFLDPCRVALLLETNVSGRKVDRRVLATDIDAELGLITCVWSRIGQMARLSTPERSRTRVFI